MNYKEEIFNLLNGIESENFFKFLYDLIKTFKKDWGY